jgi:hypothetical protein
MLTRVADRLSEVRHHQFVGRRDELALFQSIVNAPELPFFVLHVFGPGGVGKTSPFQPVSTQEQAAGLLDLPFSTCRRHLQAGLTRIGDALWRQEIGKLEK